MPQDPYAAIAQPASDPYAAIAKAPPPDIFAQDRATTEAWAQGHPILGPIARFLVAGGQNAASAITGTPGQIYHAIVDPPTMDEVTMTPQDRFVYRLGVKQAAEAAKDYASGKVSPSGAASVLPEALGAGVGQVSGGAVYGKVGEAAGDVATGVKNAAASPTVSGMAEAVPPAVSAALKKLPVAAIQRIPYLGKVLQDVYEAGRTAYGEASPAIKEGAPLPATPPDIASSMAAKALPEAFQPAPARPPGVPGTADTPFQSPGSARTPPPLPAAFQEAPARPPAVPGTADLPFKGVNPSPATESPANRLPAAFQPLPPKPPAVPGTVDLPFKSLAELPRKAVYQAEQELGPQASVSDLTARANKLSQLLNQGLGNEPIKPGVAMKDQVGSAAGAARDTSIMAKIKTDHPDWPLGKQLQEAAKIANPEPAVLEGHTPVDSSAVQSYKYDPKANEIEIGTGPKSGYVYGDVSPEQAQAFVKGKYQGQKAGDPASFGKAWNDLRKAPGVVGTHKIINGKRVVIPRVLSDEDLISPEEWEAGQQMDTHVEGTPKP